MRDRSFQREIEFFPKRVSKRFCLLRFSKYIFLLRFQRVKWEQEDKKSVKRGGQRYQFKQFLNWSGLLQLGERCKRNQEELNVHRYSAKWWRKDTKTIYLRYGRRNRTSSLITRDSYMRIQTRPHSRPLISEVRSPSVKIKRNSNIPTFLYHNFPFTLA